MEIFVSKIVAISDSKATKNAYAYAYIVEHSNSRTRQQVCAVLAEK